MFGKKKVSPSKVNAQRWSIETFNSSEVVDRFNSQSYPIDGLLGAYENEQLTLWHLDQYLCTLDITKQTFDLLVKVHGLHACDDVIPTFTSEVIQSRNATEFFFVGGDLMTLEHAFKSDEVSTKEKEGNLELYKAGKKIATFEGQQASEKFIDGLKVAQSLTMRKLSRQGQKIQKEIEEKKEKALEEKRKQEELLEFEKTGFKQIVLTTESPSPFPVKERMGIVTAEYVHRTKTLEAISANIESIGSSRHSTTEGALRKAREEVLIALRREAFLLGADAVVAVDLDYSEITGAGNPLLFLVANGTAIKKA